MTTRLHGRKVLLGVGGGIAAYKAPTLVRALRAAGAEVRVVLTRSAAEFVAPLSLEVVSEHRVLTELFAPGQESEIGHIELARWADVVLVAPATANLLSRMRVGAADDLLTTLLLATTAPVVVCPAMNTQMWMHAAVRENLEVLVSRGVTVVSPDSGELACREVGPGRLPDEGVLVAAAERAVAGGLLNGRSVVVTAGPTREYFDPVRFLSNPSSGRMGFALAEACAAHGAAVTLIAGPVSLGTPAGVSRVDVVSAQELHDAVHRHVGADLLLMSAAVADWRPEDRAEQKRKKGPGGWSPEMTRTPDVLASLVDAPVRPRVVIGFAAETESIEEHARSKLAAKRLDGIVANDVSGGKVFGADSSAVVLLDGSGEGRRVGPAPKRAVAEAIVEWVAPKLGGGR